MLQKAVKHISFFLIFLTYFLISAANQNTVWGTVNADRKPSAPSNLYFDGESSGANRLHWTDNSDNEQGFRLEASDARGRSLRTVEYPRDTQSGIISVGNFTATNFVLVAYNSSGNSSPIAITNENTAGTTPTTRSIPVPNTSAVEGAGPDCENLNITIDPRQPSDVIRLWHLECVYQKFIGVVATLAGLVALLFIVYGGFKYTTSQGDPKATASARSTLTFAILGLVSIILAYFILDILARFTGLPEIKQFEVPQP